MTFPNRSNHRLSFLEKSQQSEKDMTADDDSAEISATFGYVTQQADVEEKPEAPASVQDHALLSLNQKLMAMISQPAKLLAALVTDCDGRMSKQILWSKVIAYQHKELQGLCTSWYRVMEDIDQYELSAMDLMLLKAALYYWRMWQFVCSACIDAVSSIEESVTRPSSPPQLQKRRAASISPPLEDKCSDALSQGMILSGSGLSKRSRITKKSNEFLVAWFLAHKDNPYPSPDERVEIAEKTGLAEQQVRNWFANMRKRHWKPNRANAKKPRCLLDYVLRQSEA
ncbi:hypothetical protein PsorP6_016683 [Peronosclerospora sorghi]|uniref:Uncharacterized protein n=1 Tax=Peronosclerospora sorghi TaxID=230839 RepID=A0ACC0VQT0_9STRA|nr:hypothetical protein PsorP6_016683 [Peronosclerospora sorghi]